MSGVVISSFMTGGHNMVVSPTKSHEVLATMGHVTVNNNNVTLPSVPTSHGHMKQHHMIPSHHVTMASMIL